MLSYFKRLLWDEGAFVGMVRSVLMVVGLGVQSGEFPLPDMVPDWLGLAGVGAAMMMRSTVKPPKSEAKK